MANPATPTATRIAAASITLEGTAPGKITRFAAPGWRREIIDCSTLGSELYKEYLDHPLADMQEISITAEWAGTAYAPPSGLQTVVITYNTSTNKTCEAYVTGWQPEEIDVGGNRVLRATFSLLPTTPWTAST